MTEGADDGLRYRVEHERDAEIAVLILEGDFDLPAVEVFEQAVEEATAGDPAAVVVDTSALRFVDSSGLNGLARLREGEPGTAVTFAFVVAPGSAVDRVLEMSGLGEVLAPASDRAEAIASLG